MNPSTNEVTSSKRGQASSSSFNNTNNKNNNNTSNHRAALFQQYSARLSPSSSATVPTKNSAEDEHNNHQGKKKISDNDNNKVISTSDTTFVASNAKTDELGSHNNNNNRFSSSFGGVHQNTDNNSNNMMINSSRMSSTKRCPHFVATISTDTTTAYNKSSSNNASSKYQYESSGNNINPNNSTTSKNSNYNPNSTATAIPSHNDINKNKNDDDNDNHNGHEESQHAHQQVVFSSQLEFANHHHHQSTTSQMMNTYHSNNSTAGHRNAETATSVLKKTSAHLNEVKAAVPSLLRSSSNNQNHLLRQNIDPQVDHNNSNDNVISKMSSTGHVSLPAILSSVVEISGGNDPQVINSTGDTNHSNGFIQHQHRREQQHVSHDYRAFSKSVATNSLVLSSANPLMFSSTPHHLDDLSSNQEQSQKHKLCRATTNLATSSGQLSLAAESALLLQHHNPSSTFITEKRGGAGEGSGKIRAQTPPLMISSSIGHCRQQQQQQQQQQQEHAYVQERESGFSPAAARTTDDTQRVNVQRAAVFLLLLREAYFRLKKRKMGKHISISEIAALESKIERKLTNNPNYLPRKFESLTTATTKASRSSMTNNANNNSTSSFGQLSAVRFPHIKGAQSVVSVNLNSLLNLSPPKQQPRQDQQERQQHSSSSISSMTDDGDENNDDSNNNIKDKHNKVILKNSPAILIPVPARTSLMSASESRFNHTQDRLSDFFSERSHLQSAKSAEYYMRNSALPIRAMNSNSNNNHLQLHDGILHHHHHHHHQPRTTFIINDQLMTSTLHIPNDTSNHDLSLSNAVAGINHNNNYNRKNNKSSSTTTSTTTTSGLEPRRALLQVGGSTPHRQGYYQMHILLGKGSFASAYLCEWVGSGSAEERVQLDLHEKEEKDRRSALKKLGLTDLQIELQIEKQDKVRDLIVTNRYLSQVGEIAEEDEMKLADLQKDLQKVRIGPDDNNNNHDDKNKPQGDAINKIGIDNKNNDDNSGKNNRSSNSNNFNVIGGDVEKIDIDDIVAAGDKFFQREGRKQVGLNNTLGNSVRTQLVLAGCANTLDVTAHHNKNNKKKNKSSKGTNVELQTNKNPASSTSSSSDNDDSSETATGSSTQRRKSRRDGGTSDDTMVSSSSVGELDGEKYNYYVQYYVVSASSSTKPQGGDENSNTNNNALSINNNNDDSDQHHQEQQQKCNKSTAVVTLKPISVEEIAERRVIAENCVNNNNNNYQDLAAFQKHPEIDAATLALLLKPIHGDDSDASRMRRQILQRATKSSSLSSGNAAAAAVVVDSHQSHHDNIEKKSDNNNNNNNNNNTSAGTGATQDLLVEKMQFSNNSKNININNSRPNHTTDDHDYNNTSESHQSDFNTSDMFQFPILPVGGEAGAAMQQQQQFLNMMNIQPFKLVIKDTDGVLRRVIRKKKKDQSTTNEKSKKETDDKHDDGNSEPSKEKDRSSTHQQNDDVTNNNNENEKIDSPPINNNHVCDNENNNNNNNDDEHDDITGNYRKTRSIIDVEKELEWQLLESKKQVETKKSVLFESEFRLPTKSEYLGVHSRREVLYAKFLRRQEKEFDRQVQIFSKFQQEQQRQQQQQQQTTTRNVENPLNNLCNNDNDDDQQDTYGAKKIDDNSGNDSNVEEDAEHDKRLPPKNNNNYDSVSFDVRVQHVESERRRRAGLNNDQQRSGPFHSSLVPASRTSSSKSTNKKKVVTVVPTPKNSGSHPSMRDNSEFRKGNSDDNTVACVEEPFVGEQPLAQYHNQTISRGPEILGTYSQSTTNNPSIPVYNEDDGNALFAASHVSIPSPNRRRMIGKEKDHHHHHHHHRQESSTTGLQSHSVTMMNSNTAIIMSSGNTNNSNNKYENNTSASNAAAAARARHGNESLSLLTAPKHHVTMNQKSSNNRKNNNDKSVEEIISLATPLSPAAGASHTNTNERTPSRVRFAGFEPSSTSASASASLPEDRREENTILDEKQKKDAETTNDKRKKISPTSTSYKNMSELLVCLTQKKQHQQQQRNHSQSAQDSSGIVQTSSALHPNNNNNNNTAAFIRIPRHLLIYGAKNSPTSGRCSFLSCAKDEVDGISNYKIARENAFVIKIETKQVGEKREAVIGNAEHEGNIMSACAHPNIVGYVDSFSDEKANYLVMEYVDGTDLREELTARMQKSPPRYFSERSICFLFVQILLAVEYLHGNNILHRDLKLSNVLVSSKHQVRLCDFGLSKQFDTDTNKNVSTAIVGTPSCMAPEIILHYGYSEKTDVWALGILLFNMIEGYRPFEHHRPEKLHQMIVTSNPNRGRRMEYAGDISRELQVLLFEKMLHKDPRKRSTVKEILRTPIFRNAMEDYVSRVKSVVEVKVEHFRKQACDSATIVRTNNNDNTTSNNDDDKAEQKKKPELSPAQRHQASQVINTAFRRKFIDPWWCDILEEHVKLIVESGDDVSSQQARRLRNGKNLINLQLKRTK